MKLLGSSKTIQSLFIRTQDKKNAQKGVPADLDHVSDHGGVAGDEHDPPAGLPVEDQEGPGVQPDMDPTGLLLLPAVPHHTHLGGGGGRKGKGGDGAGDVRWRWLS